MSISSRGWIHMAAVVAGLCCASPAGSQILGAPGGLGLPGAVGQLPRPELPSPSDLRGQARRLPQGLSSTVDATVLQARRLAAAELIRLHPDLVEADEHGAPVVRGRIIALAPSPEALAAARAAGFAVEQHSHLPELGLETVALSAPAGLSAREALQRLRRIDPAGQYDLDHLYQPGGSVGDGHRSLGGGPRSKPIRIGLVDGSAAADHPALRGAQLTQRPFAPGGARVTAHGTAVASLLAGRAGAFRGGAPGAEVLVADVYGPTPQGGSASAIAAGLGWLAQTGVGVINISLVGPPNLLLGAAVRSLAARGVLVVAAVGNDGPAAPPLYPAAYPGVVAVTAVDAARRPLPEAGRGAHVAFAAPGAQMAAAAPDGGYAAVRGTSFAAPIVAAALAQELPAADPAAAKAALQRLAGKAQDLGARGRDPVFGAGLIGQDLRIDPSRLGARRAPLRGP